MNSLLLNLVLAGVWAFLRGAVDLVNLTVGFALGYAILAWLRPLPGSAQYAARLPRASPGSDTSNRVTMKSETCRAVAASMLARFSDRWERIIPMVVPVIPSRMASMTKPAATTPVRWRLTNFFQR